MSTSRTTTPAMSGASESVQEKSGFRAKTIATQVTLSKRRSKEHPWRPCSIRALRRYTERKRWVFLTFFAAYREKVLSLYSTWLDLFILRMMGYCEDPVVRPVWFVLDELASLNKLLQLHTAVTENRRYGNPVVMGIQGRSQMEKRYGQDAEAMLLQPATKVFLKTSEPRAAKWISHSIGEIEVERLKESRSMGLLRSKKSPAGEDFVVSGNWPDNHSLRILLTTGGAVAERSSLQ